MARQSMIPPGLPIYRPRAEKALRIFKRLKMVDVPGKPTMGEACDEWVFDFVWAIFGCFDPILKRQLVREFLLLIAKKNGKSSIAAGIMLTALILNERYMGEYLILAPTKDIADNSFLPAKGMVENDEVLLKRFKPSGTTREIINRLDESVLAVKAADADVVGGQKAISILIEEYWLFGKKPASENLLSEVLGSMASRPEGFAVILSTQSDEQPVGVFKTTLDYFRKVRSGEIDDPTSLFVGYEYPAAMLKAEAWRDPATFYIPNPNLGRSVDHDWLIRRARKKEQEGPHAYRIYQAKHLNIQAGQGYQPNGWAGAPHWPARADASITLRRLIEVCEAVVVGIDGGGLDDLFGFAVLGRLPTPIEVRVKIDDLFGLVGSIEEQAEDRDGYRMVRIKPWWLWSHAWCHRGVLDLRKSIATKLLEFEAAEELTIVDDALADLSQIVATVERVKDSGKLAEVAVDPAGLGEFVDAMDDIGITQENGLLVGVSQGYRMMNAIKTFERRLANRLLSHNGTALMGWCVGNVKIEPTATAIRATKQNAGDAKIDPWAAAANAVDRMALNPTVGSQIYRGIYSDQMGYEKAFAAARAAPADDEFDPAILRDMRHPAFAEHKARFERWQAAQDARETVDW